MAYTTFVLFNIFLPIPEVKVSFVFLSIYALFELGHSIFRPDSIFLLFNRPFLSTTLGHLWSQGSYSLILSLLNLLAFDRAFRLELEARTAIHSWMEEVKVTMT
jgi:hypothetical protein